MKKPAIDPELARFREEYPILADSVYMNSNSMGAMPRGAADALREYCDVWQSEGVEAWDAWSRVIDEVADTAARFFGGAPGCTTLNQNVAFFQAQVASSLDWSGARNRVVIESLMFPNVIYVWDRFRELGAEVVLVPSDDGRNVTLERMLEAIDERTAIVTLSHAVYVSGALQDIERITARAHAVGALVMVDVYQTAGAVPIDVARWGADIVVGGSHKWLCGGPGTCFMWVRPTVRERLRPRITGWMAHEDPFAFAPAPIAYAKGAWHFMGGTPSVPAYYVARHAYRRLLDVGVERIRGHVLALGEIAIARALEAGLTVNSPLDPHARTGFVAIDFPGSREASQRLIAERFKHDWRPNCGLRIGPHFYNTEEEVHRMMDRVIELARG